MKKLGARATTYLVVALLLVLALRFTPEIPDRRAGDVMQQATPVVVSRATPIRTPAPIVARTEHLNRGETLTALLKRAGISEDAALDVIRAATASALNTRYLRAGMPVEVKSDSGVESPRELVFHLGIDRLVRLVRSDSGWTGSEERLAWKTDTIAVSGTAQNQGRFYDRFEHVIYLRVPLEVLLDRVRTRASNPYGKTADQQADITRYVAEVEPLIRRTATLELDGLLPVPDLTDRVEQCLRSAYRGTSSSAAIRSCRVK